MTKNFDASGIESADMIVNMATIILIVVVVIVTLLVMIIFAVIIPNKTHRDKIKAKIVAAWDGFFWNGFIRSKSITYLTMSLSLCALFKDMMGKPILEIAKLGECCGVGGFLIVYSLFIIYYLSRHDNDEL